MKRIILVLLAAIAVVGADAQTMGTIKGSQSLQQEPSIEAESLGLLPADCDVQIIECKDGWTKVGFEALNEDGTTELLLGFIPEEFITIDESSIAKDYSKLTRVKAPATTCEVSVLGAEAITPKTDKKSNVALRINAEEALFDAVVKLCDLATGECVRMVYMKRGTTFMIANIPYGEYCVKTISGDDLCNLTAAEDGWMLVYAKEGVCNTSAQHFNFQKDNNNLHKSVTRSFEFIIQKR